MPIPVYFELFDIYHVTAPQYLQYLLELIRRCDDARLRSSARGNFVVLRLGFI